MSRDPKLAPVRFERFTQKENNAMLEQLRIIALFVEVGDAFGLMVQDKQYVTREEKACLLHAARNLPTRD